MNKSPTIKIITLFVLGIGINVNAISGTKDKAKPMSDPQIEALMNVPKLGKVILDKRGIPSHINGELGKINPSSLQADLNLFQKNFGSIFRMDDSHHLTVKKTIVDPIGMRHFRTQQYINNRKVLGGELIFHTDANSKNVNSVSGKYLSSNKNLPSNPVVTISEIENIIFKQLGINKYSTIQEPELVYMFGEEGKGILVWSIMIDYIDNSNTQHIDNNLINAITGDVVAVIPQNYHALNREVADAQNQDDRIGVLLFTEGGSSTDPIAQDAYDFMGLASAYFTNVHGFDATTAAGGVLHATIHFKLNYPDAGWNPITKTLTFGDGDGLIFGTFVVSDVVAHEVTHAIVQNLAGFLALNETGGLNEALPDIFSASADAYHNGITNLTWLFAEDAKEPNNTTVALRYMDDPTEDNISIDYYPDIENNPNPSNHTNAGVANLAYYLLVTGGQHPRSITSTTVTGIGINKAEKIFFRALELYMTSTETYQDIRNNTARAATDLYGTNWVEVLQTCYAWDAVEVPGQGTGYCNVTTEPNVTVEYIGCSPQNSPRYFVSWYSPVTVLEYDVDFKRNGSAWNSFYNGTQVSSIYTDEQYATSYIRAQARDINGFGNYGQAYLGPKSCFGGPQF